jgi:hypothetical protein
MIERALHQFPAGGPSIGSEEIKIKVLGLPVLALLLAFETYDFKLKIGQ